MLASSILAIYITIAFLLFIRYLKITNRERTLWAQRGVDLDINKFLGMVLKDSLVWPFYLCWYGIKQFIEELK